MKLRSDFPVTAVIIFIVLAVYSLCMTSGLAEELNQTVPVFYSKNDIDGVGLAVGVCGKADVDSLVNYFEKNNIEPGVFLCSRAHVANDLEALNKSGLYLGEYECYKHNFNGEGEYVLVKNQTNYKGTNAICYSIDANIAVDDMLKKALFNKCIVKLEFETIKDIDNTVKQITKNGFDITDLRKFT